MLVLDFPSAHIDDKAASELPSVVLAKLQGEEDPDCLSAAAARDLVGRDLFHAMMVMCAPDEPGEAVCRFNESLVANELYQFTKAINDTGCHEISIDGATALAIADREDPKHILKLLLTRDWVAHIASGFILRWIVSRWLEPETRGSASLAKAASAIHGWCEANGIVGGKPQNVTRNIWKEYKSVSHLWAAFYMIMEAEIDISTVSGFLTFCGSAQWLLDLGANIVPVGARPGESVLSSEDAWAMPTSHVPRTADGTIKWRIWNTDLGAHDIRNFIGPRYKQV
jgi:hypothetical protein